MANSVSIQTNKNTVKIIVDGNEIHDVLGYQLEEAGKGPAVLILKIAVTGPVEVQL